MAVLLPRVQCQCANQVEPKTTSDSGVMKEREIELRINNSTLVLIRQIIIAANFDGNSDAQGCLPDGVRYPADVHGERKLPGEKCSPGSLQVR